MMILCLQATHMADFSHVQSIQTIVPSSDTCDRDRKTSLQLRVAGSSELLTVTCPSLTVAENMADLVDGYCRLVNNSNTSIWNRKGTCLRCAVTATTKVGKTNFSISNQLQKVIKS